MADMAELMVDMADMDVFKAILFSPSLFPAFLSKYVLSTYYEQSPSLWNGNKKVIKIIFISAFTELRVLWLK